MSHKKKTDGNQAFSHLFKPGLIAATVLALCLLALQSPSSAAPNNQTIVIATPTPKVVVPTATPVADDKDDDERDNRNSNRGRK